MHERAGLITAGMAKDICSEIRGTITDLRQGQGTYIGNPLTGQRIYTPPTGRAYPVHECPSGIRRRYVKLLYTFF